MITIGVLSDTHLRGPEKWFREKVDRCFADADMILHAGDLTSLSVLEVFAGRNVHAVHGNMCGPQTSEALPASKIIAVGNFRLALVHGADFMHNIEDNLFNAFAPIDCIVYGHTHRPVCHHYGPTLMVNPGSFTATSTYAIITVDDESLRGKLFSLRAAL
jgi:putative phosphoesterase